MERQELATLKRFAERLAPGPPLLVELISGPGGGRTTMLDRLDAHLAERGWQVVRARAYPGHGAFRKSLEELRLALSEGMSARNAKAVEITLRDAVRRAERVSAVFEGQTLEESRLNLLPAMRERFGDAPILFLLDDAEHSEPLLLRMLFHFLEATSIPGGAAARMVVAATAGGVELPPRYGGEVLLKQLRLEPLNALELGAIFAAASLPTALSAAAGEKLGNAGHATPDAARRLAAELALDPQPTESLVERLIASDLKLLTARRFWRQSDAARKCLEVAAVATSGINIWRSERLGILDRSAVTDLTVALEEERWLRRSYGSGRLRFVFRQERERRIVRELVPDSERQRLHERIADLLDGDDLDPDESVSEVGQHLVRAGQARAGAGKLLRAGRHFLSQHRRDEARRHFEEVARLGQEQPDLAIEALSAREGLADMEIGKGELAAGVRRYQALLDDGEGIWGAEDRARMRRKMAGQLLEEGQLDAALAMVACAADECGADTDGLGLAVERALLFDLEAHIHVTRGDHAAAAGASEHAMERAVALADDRLLARFYETLGHINYSRGDVQLISGEFDTALDLFDKVGDAHGYAQTCIMKGNACSKLGRFDDAMRSYQAAQQIWEELGNLNGVTKALQNIANVYVRRDQLDKAEETLRHCRRVYRRLGSLDGEAVCAVNLGSIAAQRGHYQQALDQTLESAAAAAKVGSVPLRLTAQNIAIPSLIYLGRLSAAITMCQEVERDARATGSQVALAHALNSQGLCFFMVGDFARAGKLTMEALVLARERALLVEEWDSLNQLVDLETERGNLKDAREYLEMSREKVSHAFQERELGLQEIELRYFEGGRAPLSSDDVAALERLAKDGHSDLPARVRLLLARGTPAEQALRHAKLAYVQVRDLSQKEWLWRAAQVLGEIEAELLLPGSQLHFEEAARVILSIAVDLPPEFRDRYLVTFGRDKVLEMALGDRQ